MSISITLRNIKFCLAHILIFLLILVTFISRPGICLAGFEDELPVVKQIVILGNRTFDDGVLKGKMRTKEAGLISIFNKPRFRMDFLRRDLESIKSFYRKNGFFDAEVELARLDRNDKDDEVRIRIVISEGERTRVRNLSVVGQEIIAEEEMKKVLELTEGEPYNPNLIKSDRYALFNIFFEKGYLGTGVSNDVVADSTDVDIVWRIEVGKKARIREIRVMGRGETRKNLVLRELTIKRGEYFDLAKVQQSKQNLYNSGLFSSVEIEPENLDLENGIVDLNVSVRERKTGYVETGMGVGNVHASHVFAEVGQRNLLGRGYGINVKSSYSFSVFKEDEVDFSNIDFKKKYLRHEGEIRFPHILKTWNTFSLGSFYEYDATIEPAEVRAMSYTGTVSRQISRQTSVLLGYVYEHVKREYVIDEREESIKRSVDLQYRSDTRNYYFNPKRGRYLNFELNYSGGILGGDDNYYSIVASYRRYREVYKDIVFAFRVRTGYSEPFAETVETGLPIESRFFLGGGNSVRGYRENSIGPAGLSDEPLGGRVMLLTNVELRYSIPYLSRFKIGGVFFLDGGNVWKSVKEISSNQFWMFEDRAEVSVLDFKFSTGFGLRYYTPLGPIRVDAGFPINKYQGLEDDYWIHISLGQVF